jgi:hypothetical protein
LHLFKLCLLLHRCWHRVKLPGHVLRNWWHRIWLSRYELRYRRHWHWFPWNVDWWFRHEIRLTGSEFLLGCRYTLCNWFNWLACRLSNFWLRSLFVDLISLVLFAHPLYFIPLLINRLFYNLTTLNLEQLLRFVLLRFFYSCNDRSVADFWLNDDRVCFLNFATRWLLFFAENSELLPRRLLERLCGRYFQAAWCLSLKLCERHLDTLGTFALFAHYLI